MPLAGGTLITSFLTPPNLPTIPQSPWKDIHISAMKKWAAIAKDMCPDHMSNFRDEALSRQQFADAGFVDIRLIIDQWRMFPTVVCKKKTLS